MRYLLSVYLPCFFTIEYFAFVFRKHNFIIIYVVIMVSLCILLFTIHDGKPVKDMRFLKVKLNKNRGKKYFVFIILYEKKNLVYFIITKKASSVQWRLLCLRSIHFDFFHYNLLSEMFYVWFKSFYKNIFFNLIF